jgi:hypothetical protein
MKKLSSNELSVLSNEISKRVNDLKYEKIKGKLEKDLDYKKLEKVSKEIEDLRNKIGEKNNINNELILKVRRKYGISGVGRDENNEIRVVFNNINVWNDIVLYSIGKDLNIEELINNIVNKYS